MLKPPLISEENIYVTTLSLKKTINDFLIYLILKIHLKYVISLLKNLKKILSNEIFHNKINIL